MLYLNLMTPPSSCRSIFWVGPSCAAPTESSSVNGKWGRESWAPSHSPLKLDVKNGCDRLPWRHVSPFSRTDDGVASGSGDGESSGAQFDTQTSNIKGVEAPGDSTCHSSPRGSCHSPGPSRLCMRERCTHRRNLVRRESVYKYAPRHAARRSDFMWKECTMAHHHLQPDRKRLRARSAAPTSVELSLCYQCHAAQLSVCFSVCVPQWVRTWWWMWQDSSKPAHRRERKPVTSRVPR